MDCKGEEGIRDTPKKLEFNYPGGQKLIGEVTKEVRKKLKAIDDSEYCFVIQLIETKKHPEGSTEPHIRFGYYKKSSGSNRFNWASRMTYHAPLSLTKMLLKEAEEEGIL